MVRAQVYECRECRKRNFSVNMAFDIVDRDPLLPGGKAAAKEWFDGAIFVIYTSHLVQENRPECVQIKSVVRPESLNQGSDL